MPRDAAPTIEREPRPETEGPTRRTLAVRVLAAVLCLFVLTVGGLLTLGRAAGLVAPHSWALVFGSEERQVSGVHHRLNRAIWGDDPLPAPARTQLADRLDRLAGEVDGRGALALRDAAAELRAGHVRTAHDLVQSAEGQLNRDRRG
jgi:hypothetical protein